jgi:hypothetical protein
MVTAGKPIASLRWWIGGETTGFGVDYHEQLAGMFPYQRAYLDGTIFNWSSRSGGEICS